MTVTRPRVSILVPTWNRAALLAVCLQHARTAPAWAEIVVADNASTDGTAELVAELARADGRIRHLRNERNIGMVPNFNRALREARGEYVCLVCDDDLILPGHVEEKAALLDRHPEVGFVYCPWVLIDGEGRSQAVPLGSGMLTYGYVGGRDEFGDLLQNNHIMMNSVLLRKSLLEEHGYMTEEARFAPANDWELWLRLSRRVQTAYLPEPRVCVRFHEASETAKTGNNHTRSAAARLSLWRKYLLEEEPPVVLNENVWERMRALFDQDLNYWFGGDQGTVRPYLDEFDTIRAENRRLSGARVHAPAPTRQEPRTEVRGWVASGQPSCRTDLAADAASLPRTVCKPIHWHANVFDFSGYARLGRDAIRALDRAGVPQSLEAVGGSPRFLEQLGAEEARFWRGLQAERRTGGAFVCFGVPALWDGTDWYAHHRAANPGHDRYVGVCMFETDGLPAGWASSCDSMDEVWVPSTFNRETFVRAGVPQDKLRVVPFGMDANAYDPERVRPLDLPDRRGFAFLSVFQWTKRKGWDVLLRAYLEAFTASDDVCLVLRAYPERAGGAPICERVEAYERALGHDPAQAPAIVVLDDFVSDADMPALYGAADAFVLPTRGEGWGIPFMEAMASGLPTIATRWSAHRDFMTDDNSYLIDVDGLAPVDADQSREDPFYTPDQRWAEPSVTHTAALMRHVFEQRGEARAKGARARRDIVEQWPLERTARWIADCGLRIADCGNGAHGTSAGSRELSSDSSNTGKAQANPQSAIRNPQSAVSWSAPLFDPSGYAEEARGFLLALDRAGHQVAAQSIRWSDRTTVLPAADERRLLCMTARAPQPGGAHVCHILAPHFTRRADAAVNVGRTMFETDGLPADWAAACNRMDRVWVPSEFNRETFARAGVDPAKLAVVPGALDIDAWDTATPPLRIQGARGFNFLAVFDWTLRKGWDVLLRAYCEEFAPHEDVCLILKTHASMGYTMEQMVAQATEYLARALGRDPDALPDIVFQDTNLPAHRMPALYAAADCFVLPSRGEGWGRPWMEAMAMGLPAIGTRWSGNTAFMTDENSLLVDCEVVPVPEEAWRETPTYRGHRWADPDPAHLRRLMRQVFTHREAARALGARARADIAERFSYERVAAIVEEEVARALDTGSSMPAKPRGWLEQELIARPAADNPMMLEVSGVRGFLNTADIERLFERARALRPGGTLVEIGSFMGLSAIMFANGLLAAGNLSARVHCVDTWEGSPEHQELEVIRQGGLFETFLRNIKQAGVAELVVPHRKPSVEAARDFADGSVDLLFVDGDHSHEGCYADLAAWYPKLAPGGTLIGHDCAPESGVRSAVEHFARERGVELVIAGPPVNYIFELRAAKPAPAAALAGRG